MTESRRTSRQQEATADNTTRQRGAKVAARISQSFVIIATIWGVGALGLWLSSTQYVQLLALAGVAGVIIVGAGLQLGLDRLNRAQLGTGLMFVLVLLGLFLAPLVVPVVLPAVIGAMVVLTLAGYALFGSNRGAGFMLACLLTVTVDTVLAQAWSFGLFPVVPDETGMLGLAVLGNVPVVLGIMWVGREIVIGYERALADERGLMSMLIDNLPDNVFIKDKESRIIIDNVAHARLLGNSTPEQVIGKSDFDFFPRELAQKYYDDEQQIMQTGESNINFEEVTIDPEGNRHWLLTTKMLLRDDDGNVMGIVGINRDITTLKKAELERERLLLVEQEQREYLETMVAQIREAAGRLNALAAEILAAATQQASSVVEQETAVTQTVATVEEVQVTIAQTADRAQGVASVAQQSVAVSRAGQDAVADTVEGMTIVRERVEAIAETILLLSERTQQIGEIITTVNAIAEQSKLLALNASIEAARAGEEGRGFAVVAMEVRQLAEQSREATARVADILNEIQQATNTAVMVTEEGSKGAASGMALARRAGEAISDLAATIEEAAQAATQIVVSTQQQKNGMEQLLAAMQSIKQASMQSAGSARQAEHSAMNLNEMAREMERAVAS